MELVLATLRSRKTEIILALLVLASISSGCIKNDRNAEAPSIQITNVATLIRTGVSVPLTLDQLPDSVNHAGEFRCYEIKQSDSEIHSVEVADGTLQNRTASNQVLEATITVTVSGKVFTASPRLTIGPRGSLKTLTLIDSARSGLINTGKGLSSCNAAIEDVTVESRTLPSIVPPQHSPTLQD